MAPAVRLVTEPTEPLTALRAERASVAEEVKRLTAVLARLRAEASARDALAAELEALAEAETSDMKTWAANLCVGPAPKGRQAERQAIALKMATANAIADAASAAIGETDTRIADLNDQLRDVGNQIEHAVLDQIEIEHGEAISAYVETCERGSQLATKISGLALLYRETGQNQRAALIFATKLPAISTNPREVQLAADAWSRRVTALRQGSAS